MKPTDYYTLSTINFGEYRKKISGFPNEPEAGIAFALSPQFSYRVAAPAPELTISAPMLESELKSLIHCKAKQLMIMPGISSADEHYTIVHAVRYTKPDPEDYIHLDVIKRASRLRAEHDEKKWQEEVQKTLDEIFANPERRLEDKENDIHYIFPYAAARDREDCKQIQRDLLHIASTKGGTVEDQEIAKAFHTFVEAKIYRNYRTLIERWKKGELYCITYEEKNKTPMDYAQLVRQQLIAGATMEMAMFALVAQKLKPHCLYYKGSKKPDPTTKDGNHLLRLVIKRFCPATPDAMQWVRVNIHLTQPVEEKKLSRSPLRRDRDDDKENSILAKATPPSSQDNSPAIDEIEESRERASQMEIYRLVIVH